MPKVSVIVPCFNREEFQDLNKLTKVKEER